MKARHTHILEHVCTLLGLLQCAPSALIAVSSPLSMLLTFVDDSWWYTAAVVYLLLCRAGFGCQK